MAAAAWSWVEKICGGSPNVRICSRRAEEMGGTDVARRPGDLGTESGEGLDEDGAAAARKISRSVRLAGKGETESKRTSGWSCGGSRRLQEGDVSKRAWEGSTAEDTERTAGALERLRRAVLLTEVPVSDGRASASETMRRGHGRDTHESGHLVLGDDDLLAAPGGEGTARCGIDAVWSARLSEARREMARFRKRCNVGWGWVARAEAHMSALRALERVSQCVVEKGTNSERHVHLVDHFG